MDRRQARTRARRFAQLHDRLTEPTLLPERQPKIVARFGVARLEPRRGLQGDKGTVEIFRPPSGGAEVVLRVEESRRQLDRPFERCKRFGRAAEPAQHEPQTIVRHGHRRVDLHRTLILGARPVEIVLTLGSEALLIVNGGGRGPVVRSSLELRREHRGNQPPAPSGHSTVDGRLRGAPQRRATKVSRSKKTPDGVRPRPACVSHKSA